MPLSLCIALGIITVLLSWTLWEVFQINIGLKKIINHLN